MRISPSRSYCGLCPCSDAEAMAQESAARFGERWRRVWELNPLGTIHHAGLANLCITVLPTLQYTYYTNKPSLVSTSDKKNSAMMDADACRRCDNFITYSKR